MTQKKSKRQPISTRNARKIRAAIYYAKAYGWLMPPRVLPDRSGNVTHYQDPLYAAAWYRTMRKLKKYPPRPPRPPRGPSGDSGARR